MLPRRFICQLGCHPTCKRGSAPHAIVFLDCFPGRARHSPLRSNLAISSAGVLIPGLYPDEKYNGDAFTPSEIGTIMSFNQVVGAVRFRQVRSTPGIGCPNVPLNARLLRTPNGTIFEERFIDECHSPFASSNEAKTPFGPGALTHYVLIAPLYRRQ